jgi:hypothetical protein
MRIRTASAVLGALSVLLVSGCSASPAPADGTVAPPESSEAAGAGDAAASFDGVPLVPDEGSYLGVYYGDGDEATTDEAIGRTPPLHLTYFGWADDWVASDAVAADAAAGRLSLVNWEPFDVEFDDIVAGDYDEMIVERATAAAGLEHPVFVDFAAEMNEEEGWGGHDPELYVAAYRHLHDLFAAHDGGNVVWVWAPNNVDSADAPPALDYYPGDDYVDWTGIDGYNWGTSRPGFAWQSFEEVFAPMYAHLATLGKPVLIGETASDDRGGDKAAWIDEIVPTLRDDFPDIRAVVWFDVKKERDWRLRSSPASAAAFAALAADPYLAAAP